MSLLDTLKKNLTTEQFATIQDALGDDFDFDYVPRSRLNTVIKQRNEARDKLKELEDLNGGSEGEGSDAGKKNNQPKGLTQADLDAAVAAEKAKGAAEITSLQKRYAATDKLREAKVVDPDLVLKAGLIDLDKVVLDESGAVKEGLEDQIKNLVETKSYLVQDQGAKRGTGKAGGTDNFGAVTTKDEFLKLSLDKQIEFKEANPEVFKGFMQ